MSGACKFPPSPATPAVTVSRSLLSGTAKLPDSEIGGKTFFFTGIIKSETPNRSFMFFLSSSSSSHPPFLTARHFTSRQFPFPFPPLSFTKESLLLHPLGCVPSHLRFPRRRRPPTPNFCEKKNQKKKTPSGWIGWREWG